MKCSEIGGYIEEYDVFEPVGKGGFATVHRARCRNTKREVAIKKINKKILTKEKIIERVRQEVSIHSKLDHPSILTLYTFFEDEHFVYLVLELCQNGHLLQQVPFHEKQARDYLAQVVDGVLYLHSQGIMHRDLSLQNLLLDSKGRIKIADFGLATQLKKPEDKHMTMCGTPNYISPEVATRSSHGLEADVWSLGCLLYTMLVGRPPFEMKSAKSTLTKVVIGSYEVPDGISPQAKDLIHRCLIKNPRDRIKLKEIPSHPFFEPIAPEFRSSNTCGSDSGVYTLSTTGTTHHTRAPLSAICEDQENFSYERNSDTGHNNQQREFKVNIQVDSLPVRLKANMNEHPYQHNGGMFGDLKKKFAALPTLSKNEPYSPFLAEAYPHLGYSGCLPLINPIGGHPAYPQSAEYPSGVAKGSSRETEHPGEERLKDSSSVGHSSGPRDGEFCRKDSVQETGSRHPCDLGMSREFRLSGSDKHHPKGTLSKHSGTQYPDEREEQFFSRSRCAARERELGGNRRSISSEGRLMTVKEEGSFLHKSVRSNTLDRPNYGKQHYSDSEAEVSHPPGCRCSTCFTQDAVLPDVSCSICRSCNHKSWCERSHSTTRPPNPHPNHSQHDSSHHHSKHSHKSSSHSDHRSTDILKDIAPVKRIPSPFQDPPKSGQEAHWTNTRTEKHQPCLRDHCLPISSRRLRATRQESKNAILNILEDGQVCVEFLQLKRNQKRVRDVCRISHDGLRIVLYQPNGSYGTAVADTPPPVPSEGADFIFSYDNLPQRFWKKYIYASRFVQLVRERTPKITYYSDQAQCTLMENSPNTDFVARFYSGEKFVFSSGKVQFTEASGRQISVPASENSTVFGVDTMTLFEHALQVKQHCLALEEILTQMEDSKGFPNFPLVIGKRPFSSGCSVATFQRKLEDKENISPVSVQSIRAQNGIAQLGAYEGSLGGSISSVASKFPRPLTLNQDVNNLSSNSKSCHQKLFVENIGYLFQNRDEMVLKFLDGSSLQMNAYHPSEYVYTDSLSVQKSYPINSPSIPTSLRDKLSQFQSALSKMSSGRSCSSSSASKQLSYSHKNSSSSTLPKCIR